MSDQQQAQTTSGAPADQQTATTETQTQTQASQQQQEAPAQAAETKVQAETKTEQAKPSDQQATEIQYDLKLAENSLLDQSKVDDVKAYAKSKGLSPEQAQDLLNREEATLKGFLEQQQNELQKASEEWKKQAVLDKEIGGENFNKNVELAHRAIKRFGNETLTKYLDESGLGNHPDVIRMFMKIGQAMSEDKIIGSNSQGGQKKSLEEIFYGSQN